MTARLHATASIATLGFAVLLAASPDSSAPPAGASDLREQFFYNEAADRVVPADLLENPLRYDADGVDLDGDLWLSWLELTPGEGDHIWIGSRRNGAWTFEQRVTDRAGEYARPTLTVDVSGRPWLSYEGRVGDQWDVFVASLDRQKHVAGTGRRVSAGAGADIRHRVAAAPGGGLWFVWQGDRAGQFDIFARHVHGDSAGDLMVLSESPRGDWHPDVAVGPGGELVVVWDSYDGESFNVHARSYREAWRPTVAVASTAAFEGRAAVAIDHRDRVWILWEEGGVGFGHFYRGSMNARPHLRPYSDTHGPMHRFRTLRVALLENGVSAKPLAKGFPVPSAEAARRRTELPPGVRETGSYYERARLCVDGGGRVWIVYRHVYSPWLGRPWRGEHRAHCADGVWRVHARVFGSRGWSGPIALDTGQGDGMQRLEVAASGAGLAVVLTTGRTDRRIGLDERLRVYEKYRRYLGTRPPPEPADKVGQGLARRGIAIARLVDDAPAADTIELLPAPNTEVRLPTPVAPPVVAAANGKKRYLVLGDLHRHTDLSLCYSFLDGTIDDAYRYAIDVARLHFLAITDHSRDIARGDHLSLVWWRSAKEVHRHELAGAFYPFFAFERSRRDTDHNVISLRADILRPHTYPHPEFWEKLTDETIMIPHAEYARELWSSQDDRRRPLLEMYQGFRNVSAEEYAHDGLRRGYRLGFIASSDHVSTSAAYAAVWSDHVNRKSIFQALKARRTFATTARIRLLVRAGEYWMGERIPEDRLPPLEIEALGTAPIARVEIVVDGRVHETLSSGERRLRLRRDLEIVGKHFIYVRLVQVDGERAWSSPIWVTGRDS